MRWPSQNGTYRYTNALLFSGGTNQLQCSPWAYFALQVDINRSSSLFMVVYTAFFRKKHFVLIITVRYIFFVLSRKLIIFC